VGVIQTGKGRTGVSVCNVLETRTTKDRELVVREKVQGI